MYATDSSVREVPLVNGGVALVSECDYSLVAGKTCRLVRYGRQNRREYAMVGSKQLHRVVAEAMGICGLGRKLHVDHINLNGLDNRRENLRAATPQQNRANCEKHAASTSGFKGVAWHVRQKCWQARIKINGKQFWLGGYKTQEEAARAYDRAALAAFGEFSRLNFPTKQTA